MQGRRQRRIRVAGERLDRGAARHDDPRLPRQPPLELRQERGHSAAGRAGRDYTREVAAGSMLEGDAQPPQLTLPPDDVHDDRIRAAAGQERRARP